jgi:hypothetical protein
MLPSKTVVVGIVAFALGTVGAGLLPTAAARPPDRQQPSISVTTSPDAVTFRNGTGDSRFLIVALGDQTLPPGTFSRDVLTTEIPAKGVQQYLVYQVSARWFVQNGTLVGCKPTDDCPVPPPPPPFRLARVAELKPKAP